MHRQRGRKAGADGRGGRRYRRADQAPPPPPREEALKQVLSSVSVEEIIPAIEEMEESTAEVASMDREAVMAEVNEMLEQVRKQIAELEQSLQREVAAAVRSAEQGIQPLQAALGDMDTRIKEKVQASLRSRERFWDIRVPKIDSIFDNSLVPRPSWSPGVPPQHRKLVAATHRSPI